ncbi:hypothetical protein C8R46DRAFT_1236093 [Mycena filopes]|nr:hypothetical protein C8R46DRAFT_1236093 [Mycena filopes]
MRLLVSPPPIDSLPTDLVNVLFDILSTPAQPICLPPAPSDSQSEILRVSQVCREWRATAHGHQRSWTAYKLDLTSRKWTYRKASNLVALLAQFIVYAGSKDIELAIKQGDEPAVGHIPSTIVTAHSRRLSVLDLQLHQIAAENLFIGPALPFDRLQQFKLQMRPYVYHPILPVQVYGDAVKLSVFGAAPLLTNLAVVSRDAIDYLPIVTLGVWDPPLGQLTTLRASNICMKHNEVVRIFSNCTQLIICDLHCAGWTSEPDEMVPSHTPTTMAHLKELTMTFRTKFYHIWTYLTAPSLEQLHITTYGNDHDPWRHAEFLAFRHRSAFALTALALGSSFAPETHQLIEVLDTLQELEVLTLRWTGHQEQLAPEILRIAERLSDAAWLPQLHTLGMDVTPDSMGFLVARCESQLAAANGGMVQLRHIVLSAEPLELAWWFGAFQRDVDTLRTMGCNICLDASDKKYHFHQDDLHVDHYDEEVDWEDDWNTEDQDSDLGEDRDDEEGNYWVWS